MKEFLDGEIDRLADLQNQALEHTARGDTAAANTALERAQECQAIIETVVDEIAKGTP